MNRRGFLGRVTRTVAAAAAAVVVAPAVAAKVAEAAPVPQMYAVVPGPFPPEAYLDANGPLAFKPGQQTVIPTGEVRPVPVFTSHENADRAMQRAIDTFLDHVMMAANRWCEGNGCSIWVIRSPGSPRVSLLHRVINWPEPPSIETDGLHIDGFLPFYRLASEINRFEMWLAGQHAPSEAPAVSDDIQQIVDTLNGTVPNVSISLANHVHPIGMDGRPLAATAIIDTFGTTPYRTLGGMVSHPWETGPLQNDWEAVPGGWKITAER